MKPVKRVLVMRFSAMGDVAMVVPVLIAVRRSYPDVELVMLSRKRFFPILEQVPGIKLIEADLNKKYKGILGLYRLARELKGLQINCIADLHNVLRTKILGLFMASLPMAILDKGRAEKKRLIEDPNFFEPLTSTHNRYANVFKQMQLPVQLLSKDVLPSRSIPNKVLELVGTNTARWIGVAPFAAHPSKSLSTDKAIELVQSVSKIGQVKILLFGGGKEETIQLDLIAGSCDYTYNLAGIMSFEEELATLSHLDSMVSVDTGNGHLAAMYGVPVVTLWGNTHPFAGFTPYQQPIENQITVDRAAFPLIPTSIYGNSVPAGYERAIDTINCSDVVLRLEAILAATTSV